MALPTVGAGPSAVAAGAAFVGALDGVSNVAHVYWPPATLLSAHDGNSTATLRRDSDDDETTTSRGNTDGTIDTATLTTWAGGADIFVVTAVDQAGSDNITQATTTAQPALNLSDANFNNKPSMTFDGGDSLQGAFTTGGSISQPITSFAIAKLATAAVDDGVVRGIIDGDDSSNRVLMIKFIDSPDDWRVAADTQIEGGAADDNPNLWAFVANGASSEFWLNGVSEASGNSGVEAPDGVTIGANYAKSTLFWIGQILGAIIVGGNSSNADKNQVGNEIFENIYGGSYTDTV